jgi:hypothetical protein
MEARLMAGGPPSLSRALARLAAHLPSNGAADGVVLVCGLADPMLPGPHTGDLVVLAASGPGPAPPWTDALLEASAACAALTDADLPLLGDAGDGATVVGLPAPPAAQAENGLSLDEAGPAARRLWEAEVGAIPTEGPGVTWIVGMGSAPLAAAAEAWAAGRVVVALPGTIDHPLLRRGGALRTRTTLEAVEATELVRRTAPVAWALAERGRRALATLPSPDESARRLAAALAAPGGPAWQPGRGLSP